MGADLPSIGKEPHHTACINAEENCPKPDNQAVPESSPVATRVVLINRGRHFDLVEHVEQVSSLMECRWTS